MLEMLVEYAKEYCELIGLEFNNNTILIIAYSGVAAALIGGNTVHKAVHKINDIIKISFQSTFFKRSIMI